jgi:hypothetical protein
MPGADLTLRDLTMAYLIGANLRSTYSCNSYGGCVGQDSNLSGTNLTDADLTSAYLYRANLSGANLRGTNLTNANFLAATLTDAEFTDAEVRGANFYHSVGYGSGITLPQLYSTASYESKDLSGILLFGNNLAGGNFAGQNLTNAYFDGATLTDADFTNAEVRGANFGKAFTGWFFEGGITPDQLYSTASYQAHD